MSALTSWRLALRLARRDALRARGRSILVLVMIALPVLAVTTADVVIATSDVNTREGLDRKLGTVAAARVTVQDGTSKVEQGVDPDTGANWSGDGRAQRASLDDVLAALGGDRPVLETRESGVAVRTDAGATDASAHELDLGDPMAGGLFDLTAGRWPRTEREVVVNASLADRGPGLGDDLTLQGPSGDDGATRTVVGIAESTTERSFPVVAGPDGSLALADEGSTTWLVGGDPVTWTDVLALNRLGATVLSREVVLDPPAEATFDNGSGSDDTMLAVLALVVVMALIEVVLLAGPAFAVGAKRQSRSLALLATAGGTPRQARRVVLAGAVTLGSVGAISGALLGVGLGRLLVPVAQGRSGQWFGPFEVPWPHLAGIAAFGLLSALLAAVVPAWIASRQDVVAVLAGRRGDRRPSLRSPLLGVVLLALGVAGAAYGARTASNGEFLIAGSSIPTILGMVLLVPVVVVAVARMSSRLPMPLRFAVRDAARYRTRTVPAVAAVAATVAGVVALGIAVTSDEAENRETYTPQLPMGQGLLVAYDAPRPGAWAAYEQVVRDRLPGATVTAVRGIPYSRADGGWTDVVFRVPGGEQVGPLESATTMGASVYVSDGDLPAIVEEADPAVVRRAEAALAQGGAVVFTSRDESAATVRVRARAYSAEGRARGGRPVTAPATYLTVPPGEMAHGTAVVSTALAAELRLPSRVVGLVVGGAPVSEDAERDVAEGVTAVDRNASFDVERGYEADSETVIVQLVLAALGAVLMLGGTLTATFLALSDARPDLATLGAVGAAPRTRRAVAASYALAIGLVGAVLGALVGFVPGLAVTYPLTGHRFSDVVAGPAHYLDVPWLLILGVVLGLPLVTAAIVGLTARSRLPMVARLE